MKPLDAYYGKQNTTVSGLACKKWSSPEVYEHENEYGFTDMHSNYCRYWKPINALRCFTVDKSLLWEECLPDDQETLFDPDLHFGLPRYDTSKEQFVIMMSKLFCEHTEQELNQEEFNHTIIDDYYLNEEYFKKLDVNENCKSKRYFEEYNISRLVKYWTKIRGVSESPELYDPTLWYFGPHLKIHHEYNRYIGYTGKPVIKEIAQEFHQQKHFNNYVYRLGLMNETEYF